MQNRRNIKILSGITISCLALLLVLRKVRYADLLESVSQVKGEYVFYTVLVMVINLFVRAKRWQVLLKPFTSVDWLKDSFTCYSIGYMANMLLPLKPGELLRPYLLGKKRGVFKTPLLATVMLERLWDITCLAVLFFIAIHLCSVNIPFNVRKAILLGGLVAGIVLAVFWLVSFSPKIRSTASRYFCFLPSRLYDFFNEITKLLLLGVQSLNNLWSVIYVFFLTLAVWLCSFFMAVFCILAFGLHLPWYAPLFAVVITNFGMMIPSSPGAIGVAHALFVLSLSLFGTSNSTAFGVAVLVHGIGYLVVVFAGFISLWEEGLSFSQLTKVSK